MCIVGGLEVSSVFLNPGLEARVLRINRRCNIGEIAAAFASLGSCGLVATLLPWESSRYFVSVIPLAEGFRRLLPPRTRKGHPGQLLGSANQRCGGPKSLKLLNFLFACALGRDAAAAAAVGFPGL